VRWQATEAIKQNVDRSFDPVLRELLRDSDLRKRGLAAYIAARLWKRESFTVLREMLSEQSQLLRFDAISALVIEGGDEGRQIVFAHLPREQNPRLKQMIESEMSRAPRQPE
jgi:HEAT repeat protein